MVKIVCYEKPAVIHALGQFLGSVFHSLLLSLCFSHEYTCQGDT